MPEIEYRRLEPVTVYAASTVAPGGRDVPAAIDEILPPLLAALEAAGVEFHEPGIFWYEEVDGTDDLGVWVSWTAGSDPVEGAGWDVVELPAVERAAVSTYRGAMTGIRDAWHRLFAAVEADGHALAGPCREVYLEAGSPDQSTWVTELQQPVT
jgi:effector-binding domain-containing protein